MKQVLLFTENKKIEALERLEGLIKNKKLIRKMILNSIFNKS